MWPSVNPGMTVRPPRSIILALSPASFFIAAVLPDASTWPCPIASACWTANSLSTVRILPLNSTVSAVWAEAVLVGRVRQRAARKARAFFDPSPNMSLLLKSFGPRSSFRDGPKDQTSDVQLHIGESRDSGFDASH